MKTLEFNQIYRENSANVLKYVNSKVKNIHTAEDLTNEIFTKVYNHLNVFDCEKAKFNTWLYTIVNNHVIDYFRKEQTRHLQLVSVSQFVNEDGKETFEISDNGDASTPMENNRLGNKINKAIENLKPQYRKVAELWF